MNVIQIPEQSPTQEDCIAHLEASAALCGRIPLPFQGFRPNARSRTGGGV